jgi:phosphoribosyl-ATP pyrophosphohydrolase/phosphoribosyl-AMP cyclohydrolase
MMDANLVFSSPFDPRAGLLDVCSVEDVDFDKLPLIPAIVQDARSGQVLTLAYMNRESLARTLELGQTVFWSRSRQELWHKGATSGNFQDVVAIHLDCDGDALLVLVHPHGPACHTGAATCFHRAMGS